MGPTRELVSFIKRAFDEANITKRADALLTVRQAVGDFKSFPFYRKNCSELLVSGFMGADPLIIRVNTDLPTEVVSVGAIGEGGTIASVILNQRDYREYMDLEVCDLDCAFVD